MKRNNLFVGILTIIVLGLGAVIFLTVQKLQQTGPVAPTVPQVTPKAATPACTLSFSIIPPALACGASCGTGITGQCPNDHTCSNGKCVLNACLPAGATCDSTKCTVLSASPTPTPGPTSTPTSTPTPTPGPTSTPTPTSIPLVGCSNSCATNSDCAGGLTCTGGMCRNPSCTAVANCVCPTPTPIAAAPTPTPTQPPTPQVPVSGNGPSVLGASVIAGGIFLLLLGLVF